MDKKRTGERKGEDWKRNQPLEVGCGMSPDFPFRDGNVAR